MSVEAALSDWPCPGVMFTQPELEISPVVGGQLHLNMKELCLGQIGCHDPQSILTTKFPGSGLGNIIGVTTNTTESLVLRPLSSVPTTVTLMVVNIRRSVEAVPPHGGARGRLPESTMAGDSGQIVS